MTDKQRMKQRRQPTMVRATCGNRKFQHSPTVELCCKSELLGEKVMLIVSQGFCQEVSNIAFCVYIFNIDNIVFDGIANVVISDCDVFRTFVEYTVFCNGLSAF